MLEGALSQTTLGEGGCTISPLMEWVSSSLDQKKAESLPQLCVSTTCGGGGLGRGKDGARRKSTLLLHTCKPGTVQAGLVEGAHRSTKGAKLSEPSMERVQLSHEKSFAGWLKNAPFRPSASSRFREAAASPRADTYFCFSVIARDPTQVVSTATYQSQTRKDAAQTSPVPPAPTAAAASTTTTISAPGWTTMVGDGAATDAARIARG